MTFSVYNLPPVTSELLADRELWWHKYRAAFIEYWRPKYAEHYDKAAQDAAGTLWVKELNEQNVQIHERRLVLDFCVSTGLYTNKKDKSPYLDLMDTKYTLGWLEAQPYKMRVLWSPAWINELERRDRKVTPLEF